MNQASDPGGFDLEGDVVVDQGSKTFDIHVLLPGNDFIEGVFIQPLQGYRFESSAALLNLLEVAQEPLFPVFRNDRPYRMIRGKGRKNPPHLTELKEKAVFFVEGHLIFNHLFIEVGKLRQVQFISQDSEGGNVEPGFHSVASEHLMGRVGSHMGSQGGGRVEEGGSVLDVGPFPRIGVVAGPGLGHVV